MPFCSLCTLILGLKGCCNKAYASPSQKRPAEAWEEKERPSVGQVGSARVWTSSLARTYGDVNPHVAAGPAIGHHPGLLLLPSLTPAPSFFLLSCESHNPEISFALILKGRASWNHPRCLCPLPFPVWSPSWGPSFFPPRRQASLPLGVARAPLRNGERGRGRPQGAGRDGEGRGLAGADAAIPRPTGGA